MWDDGVRIYGTSGVHNNFPIYTPNKKKKKDKISHPIDVAYC